jgi:alpha-tubulin suppressor-like RCC1 family protein
MTPHALRASPHRCLLCAGCCDAVLPFNRDACAGWGDNRQGQLGLGRGSSSRVHEPAQVRGLPRIVALAAGDAHTLAVSEEGEVLAWGGNGSGQTGVPPDGACQTRTSLRCLCLCSTAVFSLFWPSVKHIYNCAGRHSGKRLPVSACSWTLPALLKAP